MSVGMSRVEASREAFSVSYGRRRRMLTHLLKSVSRAFYLSMRVLPVSMREPVGIAYLLARAADTVADSASMPTEQRLAQLHKFRGIIAGTTGADAIAELCAALTGLQPSDEERELLDLLPEVLAVLKDMHAADAERVRAVVLTLTSGMLFDLKTFDSRVSGGVVTLQSAEQLDEYCYFAAGCVGEFWTSMSMAHTPSLTHWDEREMLSLGVRFGKALQMTNILRDMPKDLHTGRCYLPQSEIEKAELRVEDLLNSADNERIRPIFVWGIRRTLEHFGAAEQYILAIPRRNLRLRLAALWPVVIGLATLAELGRRSDWLNPDGRVKIPRRAVYGIIVLSLLCVRSNTLIRLWIRYIRGRVERVI